ncbi:hypothetical protein RJ639_005738 [Escallonia herrerae]|uniref:Fungal lipase-type domain-containing protein n=1 Tax=Escallonia herrerae TaxID=1293975 RepID=A0AA88VZE4_9ASTE|nr:hypothetical protein RJ639_005738 [Escallonia herrerae]
MAATTMATAAGAVVLLYYVLSRRLSSAEAAKGESDDGDRSGEYSKLSRSKRKIARRPAQAPATWLETIATLSETLSAYVEEISFYKYIANASQGNLQVASVYAGDTCLQLKGPEIVEELKLYLRLLTLCMLFSKKPFPVFLDSAGYTQADVFLQKPKAGLLKPAFTILRDKQLKCFLLLIRGTHSIKDTLTAATGAVVPFHHSVLHDGGISNLVLGYAHCGMVAAARWIAKLSTPFLLKALDENPDYQVKIVGHSLGGGTAALLTYILREQKELSSITCTTFAPGITSIMSFISFACTDAFFHDADFTYCFAAACMTWELAESGKHFITTIINGSDLVPTFSTASVDDLRSEVTASSWLNDLRDQVERTRVLNVVYRSATALGSRLPSIASARARVAGAGALLRPVSSGTQVVMKRAQNVAQAVVKTRSSLSSWSCMGTRRRTVGSVTNSKEEDLPETSLMTEEKPESLVNEALNSDSEATKVDRCSSCGGSGEDDTDEEGEHIPVNRVSPTSNMEDATEGELWYELEMELRRQENEANIQAQEEEEAAAIEITEEEKVLVDAVDNQKAISSLDITENHHFYPPGRIMHIIPVVSSDATSSDPDGSSDNEHVGIYETPRDLYSKLRLSRTMINDHYMPMYKKMMELLIRELETNEDSSSVV